MYCVTKALSIRITVFELRIDFVFFSWIGRDLTECFLELILPYRLSKKALGGHVRIKMLRLSGSLFIAEPTNTTWSECLVGCLSFCCPFQSEVNKMSHFFLTYSSSSNIIQLFPSTIFFVCVCVVLKCICCIWLGGDTWLKTGFCSGSLEIDRCEIDRRAQLFDCPALTDFLGLSCWMHPGQNPPGSRSGGTIVQADVLLDFFSCNFNHMKHKAR